VKLHVDIDRGNGRETITILPIAFVAWERHTKSKVSQLEQTGAGIDDLAFMAYAQLKAQRLLGDEPPSYDTFLETLEDIEPTADQEDPHQPGEDRSSE
jgi:hypothetical protein